MFLFKNLFEILADDGIKSKSTNVRSSIVVFDEN